MRKVNSGLGLCVPGAFVVMAGYIGCNTTAAVAFFTISAAFNGLTGSKPYSVWQHVQCKWTKCACGVAVASGSKINFSVLLRLSIYLRKTGTVRECVLACFETFLSNFVFYEFISAAVFRSVIRRFPQWFGTLGIVPLLPPSRYAPVYYIRLSMYSQKNR